MADIDELEVSVAEVVDYMRITGTFGPSLQDVVRRKISAEAATKMGHSVSDEELQSAADAFRLMNNLRSASDTEEWLKSTGISIEVFEDYLVTNILISKLKDALEEKADKQLFIESEPVNDTIKEMIYQDWLNDQLK
jgi:hypothetical protein